MLPTIWEWPRHHRALMSGQFYLQTSNLLYSSPYTNEMTVDGPLVQAWTAKLNLPTKLSAEWRELQAFITRLRGMKGFIRMVDYYRMRTAYDAYVAAKTTGLWSDGKRFSDGKGWVSGLLPPFVTVDEPAPIGADSFVVRGLPASLPRVLSMGDLMEIRPNGIPAPHGHLYETMSHARSDASGKTRIYVEPGLRRSIVAGDMVVLRYPTSVFKLAGDQEGIVNRSLGDIGEMGLSLTEYTPWQ